MSLTDNDSEALEPIVRTLQVIIAALVLGLVTFGAMVVLLFPRPIVAPAADGAAAAPFEVGGMQVITLAALCMGLADLVLSQIVPALATARGRSQIAREKLVTKDPAKLSPTALASDAGRLLAIYQSQTILGAALAEGGAFFALIAFMLERHWAALGLAVVLAVVVAYHFPTRDRLAGWLDRQLALIQEERQGIF